ncbi:MAG: polysaccharide deacetylase family protein [Oscillospiraceae bacterium]|nr:polysaccharide deacetylase family protein [Oscillospiraceae bacterium]
MRRLLILWVLLFLPTLTSAASAQKIAVAVVFDSGPNGKYTSQLLEGLYDRGIHATFLLRGHKIAQAPQLTEEIHLQGHEIAHRGFTAERMDTLSRRSIAQQIMDTEALLPDGCHVCLFCPVGVINDSIRQVAKARRLSMLEAPEHLHPDSGTFSASSLRNGDILYLHDSNAQAVYESLKILDILIKEQVQILPVSQLAKSRGRTLRPGEIYHAFPINP